MTPLASADLTVIVVNYNTRRLLPEMMSALQAAAAGLSLQIVLVDNASSDGSAQWVRDAYPEVELQANAQNVGFGRANNQALGQLRAPFVLLLNTDAFLSTNSLRAALDCMAQHPRCGIVGVRLVGRDGVLQPSCRYFPTPWNVFIHRTGLNRLFRGTQLVDDMDWDHDAVRACDWVPGCFYLVRRAAIDSVGLFDPRFFLYYEEVDHCRRTKAAGWDVLYCPDTTVVHIGGESAQGVGPLTAKGRQISSLQIESELLYFRKHHGLPGVAAALVFTALADLILALKGLLRRPPTSDCSQPLLAHWRAMMASAWRTGGGSKPTR